ncbi:hypothetical protein [Jannaschia aquimarina]|uniref:Uncharacterized protein n=1 Tax=Jannaschia aquimarina TaxID=935700 RepID=A0A0D1EEW4_9RHOB|nr:hypothetical protein [Jannaschia aquimarina]KIT14430.1 hypothetical protein jaqu_37180 [Jannaschia aquimarina]SNT29473.1 hypothetical protein SAMN05421775_11081 [Jannaschia aquimarina]
MSAPKAPRRVADAARLLPVLGLALLIAPDLLLSGAAGKGATAPWLLYLFGALFILVVLAFLVARSFLRTPPGDET